MSSHSISPEGLALIQQFEGFRADPTQLPDGNWVVGHGHVRIGDAGAPIGRAEARSLLALDLAPFERSINTSVTADLTQQQFDALVSFAFSIGIEAFEKSAVLRRVNSGEFVAAACALDAWRKSDVTGELQIIDALVRRRAAEKALLLADTPVETSPSVFMRAKLDHAASILGAPVKYAPAPEVGAIAVVAPQPAPAQRLTEILKSEPATEALLLTRVATEEEIHVETQRTEIVTAHAKPVSRVVSVAMGPTKVDRRLHNMRKRAEIVQKFKLPSFQFGLAVETVGLGALLVFGLGLVTLGGATFFSGNGDAIDVLGASALAAPGLAATLMAAYGLWKTPHAQAA